MSKLQRRLAAGLALRNVSPVTYCSAVRTFPCAKRLECVELAPAFEPSLSYDSASKLDALQTLRVNAMPILPYVSVFGAAHS
jgi:hypothetical protein